MRLQEIADLDASHYELASIVKTFPNKYRDIIQHQAGKPHKLKWQGQDLFAESGDGPALMALVVNVKRLLQEDEVKVDIHLPTPLGDFEYEASIRDVQHVWTAYKPDSDALLLGFDGWIDEEDFNTHWDKFFEEQTGEEFDYDNDEHERIFSQVHQRYLKVGFYGLLFEVERSSSPELMYYSDNGFFKGTLSDPFVKRLDFIEL